MAHMPRKPAASTSEAGTTVMGDSTGAFTIHLLCPWCGVASTTKNNGSHYDLVRAYLLAVCQQHETCGRASLAIVEHGVTNAYSRGGFPLNKGVKYSAIVYPTRQIVYAPEGLDAHAARDFEEALRCRESGYLFASALVARRVLQIVARSIVGKQKDLYTEIGMIPPERISTPLRDAAQEVRFIGNNAAHADSVTAEEVDELLTFTEEFLSHLFVLPARLARVKAARAAGGGAAPSGGTPAPSGGTPP